MSKFKVGEIAESIGVGDLKAGQIVEILGIGPFTHDDDGLEIEDAPADYHIKTDEGWDTYVDECHLRKRRPPQDNLFTEWFKSHIITDPICVPSQDEVAKFDMTNVFRSIKYRPADLKPVERDSSHGS